MNNFAQLEKQLDINFKNQYLLEEAFTHRSYLNEGGKNRQSNERLEFLGDAVLSFLISEYLYRTYPGKPEGVLTNLRSAIVKTETLSQISQHLDFGNYLLLSKGEEKGGGRTNQSLLADTFEAFLGAVYIDRGILAAGKFLEKVLLTKIPEIINKELNADFKSRLQEIVQEDSRNSPTYKVIKTAGPDHDKKFWITVIIDGAEKETGEGKSKQEAEQSAAHATLEKMGRI